MNEAATMEAPAIAAPPPKATLFFLVRYRGHVCAAVKTGLCRKPLLLRARHGEETFRVEIPYWDDKEERSIPYETGKKIARVACARAIKRTDAARRRLKGDNLLRGVASVERLLGHETKESTRRGKRWKICSIYVP